MDLTIVGCSGSVSGPDSAASSYLVQAPHQGRTFSLVLDLGPGAFGSLYRHLDPSEVDVFGLSHLHPDHCLDLCAYYVAARYSPTAPWPRVPVYGPAGTVARLDAAYGVPASAGLPAEPGSIAEQLDHHEWQADQQIGPFDVRAVRVEHPVESYAVRVVERATGASLVYSGDTGQCAALTELAAGVDLLLVEAGFADSPDFRPGIHLSPRQAAETGAAAGASLIVLTHIPPWIDANVVLAEAAGHTAIPVETARPGRHWTIS